MSTDEMTLDCVQDDKFTLLARTNNENELDLKNGVNEIIQSSKLPLGPITVKNSKNVHIGNVIYINNIKVADDGMHYAENDTERPEPEFPMVKRIQWLAQPSINPKKYLEQPAELVIISHTATEEGFSQAENVLLARLTQTFHIESKGWDDIAYNFMIGSDGNVYEGRGWNVVGAHTQGYNARSLGIAFIGCFLNNLPPKISLQKCKDLIEYGVRTGVVDQNYRLLGHCQCRPFLSPGPRLFEEIKTWKNWNEHATQ